MGKAVLVLMLVCFAMLFSACQSTQTSSGDISTTSSPTSSGVLSSPNKGEPEINKDMTEQEAVKFYSSLIAESYDKKIQEIKCFDTNNDGEYSCVAIIGDEYDGSVGGSILFASRDSITEILKDKGLYRNIQIVPFKNYAVIIAEEGYGGSGTLSHVWKVSKEYCTKIDCSFMALKHINGTDFSAHMGAFDPWHTYKKYYFYWDDNGFKEYGGIPVTKEQLSSIEGGTQAIKKITDGGFPIGEIFYRANGIININYANGDMYDNMTLIYNDGVITIDESDDGWYNGGAGNVGGSYGGAYTAASVPGIAVYPDKTPF